MNDPQIERMRQLMETASTLDDEDHYELPEEEETVEEEDVDDSSSGGTALSMYKDLKYIQGLAKRELDEIEHISENDPSGNAGSIAVKYEDLVDQIDDMIDKYGDRTL